MTTNEYAPLTAAELAGEGAAALPDKEVISISTSPLTWTWPSTAPRPSTSRSPLQREIVAPIDAAVSANR